MSGHVHPEPVELAADDGNRLRGRVVVDGDAHQLRSGMGELRNLDGGGVRVGGVGVGHRLHHDRMRRPDRDVADHDGQGRAADNGVHGRSMVERTLGIGTRPATGRGMMTAGVDTDA